MGRLRALAIGWTERYSLLANFMALLTDRLRQICELGKQTDCSGYAMADQPRPSQIF